MTEPRAIGVAAALLAACGGGASAPAATAPRAEGAGPPARGLVVLESERSYADTLERAEEAITSRGLTLFTRIDHAAGAARAGLSLAPTAVFVFGNPKVGTPLMQASRSVAIDLPQKLLVWEERGTVRVGYNDPAYLRDRHQLGGDSAEPLAKVEKVLAAIAAEAAGTGPSGE